MCAFPIAMHASQDLSIVHDISGHQLSTCYHSNSDISCQHVYTGLNLSLVIFLADIISHREVESLCSDDGCMFFFGPIRFSFGAKVYANKPKGALTFHWLEAFAKHSMSARSPRAQCICKEAYMPLDTYPTSCSSRIG